MTDSSSVRHCPEKWIVGLDLRPSGKGAIQFAQWLSQASGGGAKMVGIHVLEEAHLQSALRYHHLDELENGANEAADMMIKDAGAEVALADRHIVKGVQASGALKTALAYHLADGLVVGRQAPREGRRLLRLGRTARRLLRMLPSPVVVVPPDYQEPADDGPVVVTTNLRQDASTAMFFGAEFAKLTGRPLVALHIIPEPDSYAAHYIPEESRRKIAEEHEKDAKLHLRQWLTGLGLKADKEEVIAGHVTDTAVDYVEAHKAALLVCGSRRLSTVERLLLTSIGSELAAHASCAVAVVPPMEADLVP